MKTLNDDKNIIINKYLYTFILFIILLRKYMISILRTDIPIGGFTSLLFYASIGLLFIQFIIRKEHNIVELVLFIISCVLYVFTREGSILAIILLAISVRDIDDNYIVKSYLLMNLAFIIFCILLGNIFPYIAQVPETHYRLIGETYVPRETFGFANPNSVFLFSLSIYAAYIFLRFDDYNKYDRIILIILTAFVYIQTMSRTGAVTIIGALIFVEFLRAIDFRKHPIIANSIKILPILFFIGSIAIGTVFSGMTIFNKLLASRPSHWHAYLVESGNIFTLFGNKYEEAIKLAHPLDSSYIYILALLGIVSLVFFMYLIYKGLDIFIKNNQKKYIAIVMIFLIYALAENILLEAGYNFTILILIKHIINENPGRFTFKEMLSFRK